MMFFIVLKWPRVSQLLSVDTNTSICDYFDYYHGLKNVLPRCDFDYLANFRQHFAVEFIVDVPQFVNQIVNFVYFVRAALNAVHLFCFLKERLDLLFQFDVLKFDCHILVCKERFLKHVVYLA